jgi:uncharacterized protein YqfB (UPF0267 family)
MEKMFIDRIKNTKIAEGEAEQEILELNEIRKQIKSVATIDELQRLMESMRP